MLLALTGITINLLVRSGIPVLLSHFPFNLYHVAGVEEEYHLELLYSEGCTIRDCTDKW